MLPTKGYFQDIECPFYNTNCGRPYCHFRHKRKLNENTEENVQETSKNVVPTYKPTPKSELANIHNSRNHIPISYVPDLSFKRERTVRPPIRIEKPTYKPTPLSLLSSANKPESSLPENHEHQETIKDIQENIASNIYDPLKSEINFEDLSNEFELIDDIINDSQEGTQCLITDNLIKLESDIEKEQNKLNILKSEIESNEKDEANTQNDSLSRITNSGEANQRKETLPSTTKGKDGDKYLSNKVKEEDVKKDKPEKKDREKTHRSSDSKDRKSEKESKDHKTDKDSKNNEQTKTSHKDKLKASDKSKSKGRSSSKEKCSKETDLKKSDSPSKPHKSSEREKHRKEEKKHCSKDTEHSKDKHKSRDKSKTKDKERSRSPKEKKSKKHSKHKNESTYDSESSSSDSNPEYCKVEKKSDKEKDSSKNKKHKSRHRSRSRGKKREKKSKSSQSRSKSRSVSKEKHSKPKSKHKSRDRSQSRTRHKDEDKKHSRSRQDKEKSNKDKDKSKDRKDSSKSSSKEKTSRSSSKKSQEKSRKPSSDSRGDTSGSESHGENHHVDDYVMETETFIPSDVDLDLDDEDETMRECYKIFNEYKPEPIKQVPKIEETEKKNLFEDDDNIHSKKRTAHAGAEKLSSYPKLPPVAPPKTVALPGQVLANRYKIAKMAQACNEQENIMNEVKTMTQQPVKRPAASLLEAARLHKMKRLEQQKAKEKEKPSVNVVDDILNGVHRPSPSQVKVAPKKIAAVANVALFEKAKERISLVKQQRLQNIKTIAQTQKTGRVAHVPEYSLANIPDVIQADKSKLPVNVRTRFLTMIADECSKLYALKEDAYNRALNEEFACYEKCKVLATYRNSAMLAVNRLRKEIQERENKGLGPLLSGENSATKKESDFEGRTFYNHVKKWILTEEELDIHGYPRESGEKGKAIINNRVEVDYSLNDDNQRKCSRCSKIYQVDDDGWPLYDEECMYHPLKKRTIRGEQIFLCCKSSDDTGCAMSDTHVFDGTQTHLLEGYQTTLPPETDDDPRSSQVYALDCEMCYTTKGLELTRVTIVDVDCKTVYESLVKPLNPIIDYNTRFSGITKDQMDRTSTSILQVQANILHLCNSETILVGHSLESDMKALKIVHGTIIDTSVLFPHKMGLPHKRALRQLASEYLKKIIQNDVAGHDSAEDAVSCMDLIKWKLKEELKTRTKGGNSPAVFIQDDSEISTVNLRTNRS